MDVSTIIKRQGMKLDRAYVVKWLREFEVALDDSTLVVSFERMMDRVG